MQFVLLDKILSLTNSWQLKKNHGTYRMTKSLLLVVYLFFPCCAFAQKPLDRGIHKRKTGGIAVMLRRAFSSESITRNLGQRDHCCRAVLSLSTRTATEIPSFNQGERELLALSLTPKFVELQSQENNRKLADISIFSLEKKGALSLIQNPSLRRDRALVLGVRALPDAPTDGFAVAGLLIGVVALFTPGWSLLGIVLSAIGLTRTNSGLRRGRQAAVAGLICGLLSATIFLMLSSLVIWSG